MSDSVKNGGATKALRAMIGKADAPNHAGVVISKAVWQQAIADAAPRIQRGDLCGCVDEIGPLDGGNLKNQCIKWHGLELTAAGNVIGSFAIAPTRIGEDLKKQLAANMKIAFKPAADVETREPTSAEQAKYPRPVRIATKMQLRAINAVAAHAAGESATPESLIGAMVSEALYPPAVASEVAVIATLADEIYPKSSNENSIGAFVADNLEE